MPSRHNAHRLTEDFSAIRVTSTSTPIEERTRRSLRADDQTFVVPQKFSSDNLEDPPLTLEADLSDNVFEKNEGAKAPSGTFVKEPANKKTADDGTGDSWKLEMGLSSPEAAPMPTKKQVAKTKDVEDPAPSKGGRGKKTAESEEPEAKEKKVRGKKAKETVAEVAAEPLPDPELFVDPPVPPPKEKRGKGKKPEEAPVRPAILDSPTVEKQPPKETKARGRKAKQPAVDDGVPDAAATKKQPAKELEKEPPASDLPPPEHKEKKGRGKKAKQPSEEEPKEIWNPSNNVKHFKLIF